MGLGLRKLSHQPPAFYLSFHEATAVKLSTRLSVFFLGMLALVLIGFSLTVYFVARHDLYSKVDDHLEVLFGILRGAAEVEDTSVEWKREELLPSANDQLRRGPGQWMVTDGDGKWIDGLPADGAPPLLLEIGDQATEVPMTFTRIDDEGKSWRVTALRAKCATGPPQRDPKKDYSYEELVLGVAVSLDEAHATLAGLRWWLFGTSAGIWLVIAVVGRWLCQRALSPVTQMAAVAREMGAGDFSRRLPVSHTGDEVEDLGTAFNELLVRLQDSFERQRGFTGEASHQLRTPLTAILGQLEVALRRERDAGEYREVLESVQRQSGNLHKIVESLLFLARADGKSQLDRLEQLDLAEWAEALVADQDDDGPAGVRFERRTEGPFVASVQSVLLSQLVNNLIDNAQRYGASDQPVTLGLSRNNGVLSLSVEDHGSGIAEQDLPHVFEPFYRAPEVRKAGQTGHGLGLAVARRIATAHGGTLEVESTLGQGSRFVLELPAAS